MTVEKCEVLHSNSAVSIINYKDGVKKIQFSTPSLVGEVFVKEDEGRYSIVSEEVYKEFIEKANKEKEVQATSKKRPFLSKDIETGVVK